MAKTTEKVSIIKFETALRSDDIVNVRLTGSKDVDMKVRKLLPLTDMLSLVNEVVESCVDIENGEYTPEAYDFALRSAVISRYTNITLPSGYDKKYWLLYNTGAFDQVMEIMDANQYKAMLKAIDDKISFNLTLISSTVSSKMNEIATKLNEMMSTIGSINNADMQNLVSKLSVDEVGGKTVSKDIVIED